MRRLPGVLGVVTLVTLAATACGGPTSSGPTATASPPSPAASPVPSPAARSPFFAFEGAGKTVALKLISGYNGSAAGFNFDGYANGAMKVTVPIGWTVTVTCANQGAINHSCAIVSGANSTTPAFPGASSPSPTAGIPHGQQQTFTFTPDRAGTYRIACLVPGHESSGMWDAFEVTSSGLPAFSAPPGSG